MKSPFRPDVVPNAAILDNHKPLIRSFERRGLIRGGFSLGALVMLSGCDLDRPESVESALLAISRLNDGVQALLFDPNKLAPTYPASMILRPPKFNAYYDVMDVKPVNGATWRLELSGLIADRRPWTLPQLQALPQTSMVIKHICVEGWSYIGGWTGVPLRAFLERIGADLRAKYVAFKTTDEYPSSIDMATALHPQTLLALSNTATTRLPIPSDIQCACAWRPSLGTKTPSGSRPSRLRTLILGDIGKRKAFHGLRAYETRDADPHFACVLPRERDHERGACAEHDAGGHATSARYESGGIRCHAVPAAGSGRRSSRQGRAPPG